MEHHPRNRRWPWAAAAATAAVLFATLVVIAPFLIDTPAVKEAIRRRLETDLGGRLSFERIELSLFPHPCAVLRRPDLRLPRETSLRLEALSVCPRLIPLLRGRFEPSAVRLAAPVLEWTLPAAASASDALRLPPPREFLAAAATALKGFPETLITIEDGRLILTETAGAGLEIRSLAGSLERRGNGLKTALACESDTWKQLTLAGELDIEAVKGGVQLDLDGFLPAKILAHLFPDADLAILGARSHLNLNAHFDGVDRIGADFRAEAAPARLRRREREMDFGEWTIAAKAELNADRLTVSAQEIDLSSPKLTAALSFTFDPAAHPRIAAEISGSGVDADAVRGAALFFMPENAPVRDIFNVVRGGLVTAITVRMTGDRLSELTDRDTLFIRGHLDQGKIFVPGAAALDLNEVEGDAVIANGVLEGTGLKARYRGSRGTDGRLRLGLTRSEPVLEHSILVDADLADLPAVLERVVDNAGFRAELKKVKDFRGTARGTLRLAGTRQAVQVRVEAAEVRLDARYLPIGLPLAIKGGRISYDRSALELADLNLAIGRSVFPKLDARLALGAPFELSARSPAADLDLGEAFQLTQGLWPDALRRARLRSVEGRARLAGLKLEGPASVWRSWAIRAAGSVHDLVVRSDHLPAAWKTRSGSFRWEGRKLIAVRWDSVLGTSTVSGLSGQVGWGAEDLLELHAESARVVCEDLYPWVVTLDGAAPFREHVNDIRGVVTASDLSVKGPLGQPGRWRIEARTEVNDLLIRTTFMEDPLRVEGGRVNIADAPTTTPPSVVIEMDSIQANSGATSLAGGGRLTLSPADVALDLSVVADDLDWNAIRKAFDRFPGRTRGKPRPVRGRLTVRTESFAYDKLRLHPLYAEVRFGADGTQVTLERAEFCGIPLVGRLTFSNQGVDAYLAPIADGKELEGLVVCLTDQNSLATGRYNVDGALQAKGRSQDLLKSMTGEIRFVAEKGRILRLTLLAKVLALVNITEIYKGKLPDLSGEGVDYDRMQVIAEAKEGKLLIHSWTIDGPNLWMGSRGEVDLASNQLDLTVLVSPFKTVDRIINQIPGVRWILGGRLVAIPMRASGDVFDPQVTPLSPASLGTGLLEMIERTLTLPVTIIQPLIPGMGNRDTLDKSTIRKE